MKRNLNIKIQWFIFYKYFCNTLIPLTFSENGMEDFVHNRGGFEKFPGKKNPSCTTGWVFVEFNRNIINTYY